MMVEKVWWVRYIVWQEVSGEGGGGVLNQGLELGMNLRGIWKKKIMQLIRGVAEKYIFAD